MSEAPTREWLALHHMDKLVDVSDGAIVKGPGVYLVRADVVDRVKRERNQYREALNVIRSQAHCTGWSLADIAKRTLEGVETTE